MLRLIIPFHWYIDWHLSILSYKNLINVYGLIHPLTVTPSNRVIKNNLFKNNLFEYNYRYDMKECHKFLTTNN